jgi:hypothetical protein
VTAAYALLDKLTADRDGAGRAAAERKGKDATRSREATSRRRPLQDDVDAMASSADHERSIALVASESRKIRDAGGEAEGHGSLGKGSGV